MWLQPPFFSISCLHFGHCFVLFKSQMTLAASLNLLFQLARSLHFSGACILPPHFQQVHAPHLHCTSPHGPIESMFRRSLHFGFEHLLTKTAVSIDFWLNLWMKAFSAVLPQSISTSEGRITDLQPLSMHLRTFVLKVKSKDSLGLFSSIL